MPDIETEAQELAQRDAAQAAEAAEAAEAQQRVQDALELEIAGLSKEEAEQVTVTVADDLAAGTLTDMDIFDAKLDAQAADDALDRVDEARHEQAIAVEAGDYEKAEDMARLAEYDLKVADERGAEAAHPTIEAQQDNQYDDVRALENASDNQETATTYANDAAAYAADGDFAHADQLAATADAHAETAMVQADTADAGGSYSSASASDTSADTTTE